MRTFIVTLFLLALAACNAASPALGFVPGVPRIVDNNQFVGGTQVVQAATPSAQILTRDTGFGFALPFFPHPELANVAVQTEPAPLNVRDRAFYTGRTDKYFRDNGTGLNEGLVGLQLQPNLDLDALVVYWTLLNDNSLAIHKKPFEASVRPGDFFRVDEKWTQKTEIGGLTAVWMHLAFTRHAQNFNGQGERTWVGEVDSVFVKLDDKTGFVFGVDKVNTTFDSRIEAEKTAAFIRAQPMFKLQVGL